MSSSKDNNTYKKTSFLDGNNSEFINEFYADYLSDPKSLPESWRKFFDGLSDEEKLIYNDLKGPSWSPAKKDIKVSKSKSFLKDEKEVSNNLNSNKFLSVLYSATLLIFKKLNSDKPEKKSSPYEN